MLTDHKTLIVLYSNFLAMGCGASAVQQQLPESGPVGSATALARWKRDQQPQAWICKAQEAKKDETSDVETNSGVISLDGISESPTEEESRLLDGHEAIAFDESSRREQLRLQIERGFISAAESGELQRALQEVQETRRRQEMQEPSRCEQLRLQMSKGFALAAESGELERALQEIRPRSQAKTVRIVAPPDQPHFRRTSKKKTLTAGEFGADAKIRDTESTEPSELNNHKHTPRSIKKKVVDSLERCSIEGSLESLVTPIAQKVQEDNDKDSESPQEQAFAKRISVTDRAFLFC